MFKKVFISLFLFTSSLSASLLDGIDAQIENAREIFDVPGVAVGLVIDGEVVLARGYGKCSLNSDQDVTNETLFPIGSCTKAFTTCIMGQLVEEGLVNWDEKVITYLPEFRLMDRHATHTITVRDLLTHCSGLPRHDFVWYNSDLKRNAFLSRLPYLEPTCDLREKFQYNNLMYVVAGLLIEKITGKSWEEVVYTRILEPLSMEHSNFSVDESQLEENFASPHDEINGEIREISFRNISNTGPAGSLNSSVEEMLRWIELQLSENPDLLKKETLKEMHTLQTILATYPSDGEYDLGYGLGWMLGVYKGHYIVHHGGGIDGFIAQVTLVPEKKIGLVILTNSSQGGCLVSCLNQILLNPLLGVEREDRIPDILEEYTQAINGMKQMQKLKEEARVPNTSPSHALSDYVGEYTHPGYGVVTIKMEGESLHAVYNRIETPLVHWHFDTFVGSSEGVDPVFANFDFSFDTDTSGNLCALRVPFEPTVDPILFKKRS